ncbi:hypothetical protein GCM10025768_24080 [Microbacterium pseudoresistens]|uniref:DUF4190 domain-containing protein n=1 Tax=Microbacterium pseudoresistens TaxID=640634 RepID=A0A7Y9EWU1_9MICO|nr:DUF4190 domain-containing protein [Microbacterium pseudoresistens]NYD55383.1 hypothetical protein [Microbacterium pseudoresistens]
MSDDNAAARPDETQPYPSPYGGYPGAPAPRPAPPAAQPYPPAQPYPGAASSPAQPSPSAPSYPGAPPQPAAQPYAPPQPYAAAPPATPVQPYAPHYPYASAPYAALQSTSGLAVTSLVCGIGGLALIWIVVPLLASIAAVITGHMALSRLKTTPHIGGRGMAITGLILGYVGVAGLAFIVIGWLVSVLFLGAFAATMR